VSCHCVTDVEKPDLNALGSEFEQAVADSLMPITLDAPPECDQLREGVENLFTLMLDNIMVECAARIGVRWPEMFEPQPDTQIQ